MEVHCNLSILKVFEEKKIDSIFFRKVFINSIEQPFFNNSVFLFIVAAQQQPQPQQQNNQNCSWVETKSQNQKVELNEL